MEGKDRPRHLDLANFDTFAWSYANAEQLFATAELTPGATAEVLEELSDLSLAGRVPALERELRTGRVAALTVMHDGAVAYRWGDGGSPRLLMSVSKVMVSLSLARLVDEGELDPGASIRDLLPELPADWDGCRVHHVWDMASGVDCPEVGDPAAYNDPRHPFYKFEASLGWRPKDDDVSPYELVAGLRRSGTPGSTYEYTSVNTFLLAWIIERCTGVGYALALQQLIWDDLALAHPARICLNDAGVAVSHGGIVMSVDDVARFGSALTPSWQALGHRRSPSSIYRALLSRPRPSMDISQAHLPDPDAHPGCQWNAVWRNGACFKSGFGGQGLYVNPETDVVIAYAGDPAADGRTNQLWTIYPLIAELVATG